MRHLSQSTRDRRPKSSPPSDRWGAGSLSLRKSPCIRENCAACASGRRPLLHRVIYGRPDGKRLSIYTPDQMVPEVREAIASGRLAQELLTQAGVRYMEALKSKRRKVSAGEKTAGRGYGMLNDFGTESQTGPYLSDDAQWTIAQIRNSDPCAPRGRRPLSNVTGRYPSGKMGEHDSV